MSGVNSKETRYDQEAIESSGAYESQESPGHKLTAQEAAELAGCVATLFYQRAKVPGPDGWFAVKSHHFRLVDQADTGEARPRHSLGTSTPLNPHVIGAGSRIPQAADRG
jgi:hypothetical protein